MGDSGSVVNSVRPSVYLGTNGTFRFALERAGALETHKAMIVIYVAARCCIFFEVLRIIGIVGSKDLSIMEMKRSMPKLSHTVSLLSEELGENVEQYLPHH